MKIKYTGPQEYNISGGVVLWQGRETEVDDELGAKLAKLPGGRFVDASPKAPTKSTVKEA